MQATSPSHVHPALCLLVAFSLCLLPGCDNEHGSKVTDTVNAEVFSCPEADVTWSATKGTCPLRDQGFRLSAADCSIDIAGLDGGDAPSWEGTFTSQSEFDLRGGPSGWSCTGGWGGSSADLTCETDQGSLCVLTLEAPCADIGGRWQVTSGMCFDLEARYTLVQGLSCELAFQQDDAPSSAVPDPASVEKNAVSFTHATYGACVGAVASGTFQGKCDDGCSFEMKKTGD